MVDEESEIISWPFRWGEAALKEVINKLVIHVFSEPDNSMAMTTNVAQARTCLCSTRESKRSCPATTPPAYAKLLRRLLAADLSNRHYEKGRVSHSEGTGCPSYHENNKRSQ